MDCTTCQIEIREILLDPSTPASPDARIHLEGCEACSAELRELQATFALMDAWGAPEPSVYFDQKLAVRLREMQAAPVEGWMERLRSYLLFSTGRQLRPAMAGAFALVLVVGGGALARVNGFPARPQPSATVKDLQLLDRNEQALQQMDLLQEDERNTDGEQTSPLT